MSGKPNILIFMTDHQRADTVYPYNRAITPNVDKLAQNGVAFSRAYCPSPHCCPCRATFFSGLYPSQHGVWNNVDEPGTLSSGLYNGVELFSEYMAKDGYAMDYSGKWHVSAEEGPQNRGFRIYSTNKNREYVKTDRAEKPRTSGWDVYKSSIQIESGRKDGEIVRPGYPEFFLYGDIESPKDSPHAWVVGHDNYVLEDAVNVIRSRNDERPWCHFVGMLGPHDPYFVPKKFVEMYDIRDIELPESFYDEMKDKPALYRRTQERFRQLSEQEHKKSILNFLTLCSYEDYLFGEIMSELEKAGQLDNTIVLYISDHGDYMGEHGLWTKGLPCFNGAYHIPVIFGDYGAGIIDNKSRVEERAIRMSDIADSILDIANTTHNMKTIGRTLMPFLKNEEVREWDEDQYTQSNGNEVYGIQRSVVSGKWRYTFNAFDFDELYDLENDPNEMHNLINDSSFRDIVYMMCKKMWEFARRTDDVCVCSYIATALAQYGPGIIDEFKTNSDSDLDG